MSKIVRSADDAGSDLMALMRFQLMRYLVTRKITCPLSGRVLDVRTCVVILDADGDPHLVLSPEGWDSLDESVRAEVATADGSKVDDPRHQVGAQENGVLACSCGATLSDGQHGLHLAGA